MAYDPCLCIQHPPRVSTTELLRTVNADSVICTTTQCYPEWEDVVYVHAPPFDDDASMVVYACTFLFLLATLAYVSQWPYLKRVTALRT